MNGILMAAGIAIVSLGTILLLRQYKPEYAFGISVAVGLVLFISALSPFKEVLKEIEAWISLSSFKKEEYSVLLRCFGICVITKITVQTCMDCQESSLASKVDLFGKISVLLLALPLFSKLLGMIRELML